MNHQGQDDEFHIRISILHKIIILVAMLILMAVGISTYLAVKTESEVLTKGLIHTSRHIVMGISSGAQSAFGSLNWIFVEKMLKESTEYELHEVIYSKVVKPDGEVYMANDRKYYGDIVDASLLVEKETLLDNWFFPEFKEYGMLLVRPFTIGKDRWHTILGISLKSVEKATRDLVIRNIAWGGAILLFGIVLSFILFRSISRPLIGLAEVAKIISGGDLDHDVVVRSRDEVGLLGHSFNRMIKNLKAAQSELESSEKRYRTLIETAAQAKLGIIVVQNDREQKGIISYANHGLADLLGYTREEFSGMTIKDIIHPDNYDDVWGMYTKKPPKSELRDVYQFRLINKKGEKIPVEMSTGLTEFNNKSALVCYIKDITEKLEAQE
ncbi:MAG: PAS domain S-box protein, partial [Thermodesulfobacteriota bacterium]|nr:PAS domain S-box protein [Thermodesulfobacteriota bacterium]